MRYRAVERPILIDNRVKKKCVERSLVLPTRKIVGADVINKF